MQIPKRRGEELRESKIVHDNYVTPEKIERLKKDLDDLIKRERPEVLAEVQRTREMGDLSENAGYQISKARLRQIDGRIMSIQDRLKNAVVIEKGDDSGRIRIGSTVELELSGKMITYEILGSQESNPLRGRISHLSPLGRALLGHVAGEEIDFESPAGVIHYKILAVK